MPLRLTPNTIVRKYGRTYHLHHGVKLLCQVAWINTRRHSGQKGREWVQIGVFCPVCGFHPNKTANNIQRQGLEAILGL